MARPALATVEDLERLLGDVDNPEQALALLEQASEIVRAEAGRTWLNADESAVENVPGAIPGVVTAMVVRAVQNPTGVTQDTTGPFTVSYGPAAAQRLFLTKPEKQVIRAAVGSTGVRTIGTTRGPLETPWVDGPPGTWPEETMTGLTRLLD